MTDREKIERFIADIEQARNLYKITDFSDKTIAPSDTMCAYLIEKGYGNVKEAVKEFAEKLRQTLENYRLENEYFDGEEPNGNLWQMNSSIFYLEVIEKGGLIDKLVR